MLVPRWPAKSVAIASQEFRLLPPYPMGRDCFPSTAAMEETNRSTSLVLRTSRWSALRPGRTGIAFDDILRFIGAAVRIVLQA